MWIENEIYKEDLESILTDDNIPLNQLNGKNILVTGATGLIGSFVVNALLYANMNKKINCNVYALVRNKNKADNLFLEQLKDQLGLHIICSDIMDIDYIDSDIDYIVHAASQTSSKGFVTNPVETIKTTLVGTEKILEIARQKKAQKTVFLSTMEVYGTPTDDRKISENSPTDLDTMNVRNCYPISKRMAENLCTSYSAEYGVPVSIARLTQTFGAGVDYNDGRVFAEFARCVIENRDIVLHTKGETKRNYLYTADAVRAIFTILLKGENQNAYNVANENTYCSILEMAQLVAEYCSQGKVNVCCEIDEDLKNYGYAPTLHMNLDTSKLCSLGWKPNFGLKESYNRLVNTIKGDI